MAAMLSPPMPAMTMVSTWPGDTAAKAVGHKKVHFAVGAQPPGVLPGFLQGLFPEIGGNDVLGRAGFEQMDAQIPVVTAHVGHPGAGGHQRGAQQEPLRDGKLHAITSTWIQKGGRQPSSFALRL